jgi:hypothetical protein
VCDALFTQSRALETAEAAADSAAEAAQKAEVAADAAMDAPDRAHAEVAAELAAEAAVEAEAAAEEAAAMADTSSVAEDAADDAAALAETAAEAAADAAERVASLPAEDKRRRNRRLLMSPDCPQHRFLLVRTDRWSISLGISTRKLQQCRAASSRAISLGTWGFCGRCPLCSAALTGAGLSGARRALAKPRDKHTT